MRAADKKRLPRLAMSGGYWRCFNHESIGFGKNPRDAYSLWLRNKLLEHAVGRLYRHPADVVDC